MTSLYGTSEDITNEGYRRLLINLVPSLPASAADSRKNILFIFGDDWGWGDLSCHGHPYVKTPNIDRLGFAQKRGLDPSYWVFRVTKQLLVGVQSPFLCKADRLAKQGTDFQRFTVASGVCSPSRTAVLTGHFPARYNIDGHFAWVPSNASRNMPDWLDPKAPLLTRFLRSAGYRTAHYGKWHLGNDMIPDSAPPAAYGFGDFGAFNCSGEPSAYADELAKVDGIYTNRINSDRREFS